MMRFPIGMALGLALMMAAPAARAQPPQAGAAAEAGWLERANRSLYDFNRAARDGVASLTARLPSVLPSLGPVNPALREGAINLISTWIAEPWQALALAAAGRGDDSLLVLDRVRTNIVEGQGGLRDLATERGMPTAPYADIGLALCARGVGEGPYVVFPIVGGRTLRDGLSDIIIANALIYGTMVPFTGPTPPLEVFIAVEILDNIPIWALAERMGRAESVRIDRMSFEEARDAYLATRREGCERLRGGR